ncbi:MAG: hypothetical protein IKI84_11575 [Clostridia bacterium]|nr:hypothetical protein [Clostridia bacterium]
MDLSYAYEQVLSRLERLDFSALFGGFRRFPFALYNEAEAFFDGKRIEKPAEFIANTSVMYNGEYIAIWNLMEEAYDFDVLASKLAHEMFHAFQNANGEKRWANERAALVKYRYEEANFAAKMEEAECMRRCLSGIDREAFERLLALRKARMECFPFAYDYEARIEQIEGTANYVEMEALSRLDREKGENRMREALEEINDPSRYFPVRAVTYLTGAAFLACLGRYADMDTERFTDTPFSIEALKHSAPCPLPEKDACASACLEKWRERTREKVSRALEKNEIVLEGPSCLAAWNVYDGYWDGTYAILTYFLGYTDGPLPETQEQAMSQIKFLKGDFVAEMNSDMTLLRVWRQE